MRYVFVGKRAAFDMTCSAKMRQIFYLSPHVYIHKRCIAFSTHDMMCAYHDFSNVFAPKIKGRAGDGARPKAPRRFFLRKRFI